VNTRGPPTCTIGPPTRPNTGPPGSPASAPTTSKATAAAAPLPLQKGTGTVLIVEDGDELRRIASAILQKCGYRVFDCDNGQDAIEMYRRLARQGGTPDVVLMDLNLGGGLNGAESTAQILRFDPNARIVVTSGSVSEDVQMAFLEHGFIDVLSKPYEAGELSMMVKKIATMPAPAHAA
jgi:CheY-like chemotaxis protein